MKETTVEESLTAREQQTTHTLRQKAELYNLKQCHGTIRTRPRVIWWQAWLLSLLEQAFFDEGSSLNKIPETTFKVDHFVNIITLEKV